MESLVEKHWLAFEQAVFSKYPDVPESYRTVARHAFYAGAYTALIKLRPYADLEKAMGKIASRVLKDLEIETSC